MEEENEWPHLNLVKRNHLSACRYREEAERQNNSIWEDEAPAETNRYLAPHLFAVSKERAAWENKLTRRCLAYGLYMLYRELLNAILLNIL